VAETKTQSNNWCYNGCVVNWFITQVAESLNNTSIQTDSNSLYSATYDEPWTLSAKES